MIGGGKMSIFHQIIHNNAFIKKDSKSLIENCIMLKKNMSGEEKKILLSIIDEKDLMIENAAYNNYEKGFCTGVQFASEIFLKKL
jgi:hypothetical protein